MQIFFFLVCTDRTLMKIMFCLCTLNSYLFLLSVVVEGTSYAYIFVGEGGILETTSFCLFQCFKVFILSRYLCNWVYISPYFGDFKCFRNPEPWMWRAVRTCRVFVAWHFCRFKSDRLINTPAMACLGYCLRLSFQNINCFYSGHFFV